jgi:2-haloacid dehalogenase
MAGSSLDFSRFQIITFDCYGTLIDWETGILGALRPMLAAHGAQLSDAEVLALYGELEAEEEAGTYRRYREILASVVRRLGQRLGFDPTTAEADSLANSLRDWQPFPDTVAALHRLKKKFKLGIISNIDDELFAATQPKLEVKFDQIITAAQAQAYKPSLATFRLAQQRIQLPVTDWLHAAQSLYHDVVPARALGISSVWVNRRSQYGGSATKAASAEPHVTVASVQELADLAC